LYKLRVFILCCSLYKNKKFKILFLEVPFILILSIIFTGYLFSQTEGNETIKADTVINIDSVVVADPVNGQKKKDFKKYDFYNDYLPSLPKTTKTNDKLTIDDSTKISIISAKLGFLLFWANASVTLDIPIGYKSNFAAKCFYFGALDPGGNSKYWKGLGLGLGIVTKKTDNVIIKYNMYPSLVVSDRDHGEKVGFAMNIGMDVILWKVLSVGLDVIIFDKNGVGGFVPLPTVGLNIVY